VFETVHVIPHRCERCGNDTLWQAPKVLGENELVTGNDAFDMMGSLAQKRSRTINDRKYARISMKNAKAALHRPGSPDDVVSVVDMSRGGIRFLSQVNYAVGMKLEVAVPYTEGGANVFTPARIARVQSQPMNGIAGEFGLEYVKG
jgi:PilZ domain